MIDPRGLLGRILGDEVDLSEEDLRGRVTAWWRALHDPGIPLRRRAAVWAALAYVALPFDIVPEALLLILGAGDDLMVVLFLARSLWTLPEARHFEIPVQPDGEPGITGS